MKLALVYQAGIANVFLVEKHGETLASRGNTVRVVQADFRTCEQFCRGAHFAGAKLYSYACNEAGDIRDSVWTAELDSAPFSDKFHPIYN
jgi:hypothetical protein